MLSTHLTLMLMARKPELKATVAYTDAIGAESVRTIRDVQEPGRSFKGALGVKAYDEDLSAWRAFVVERMAILTVWEVTPDGGCYVVDPAKLAAHAFATRLTATLERVTTLGTFDAETTAYLGRAVEDARRITRALR